MIDFTNAPVIDAHAHPFMPSREKKGMSADLPCAYIRTL